MPHDARSISKPCLTKQNFVARIKPFFYHDLRKFPPLASGIREGFRRVRSGIKLLILCGFCFLSSFSRTIDATFFGDVKTGLQNVASDRFGYSLFVPEEYAPDRKWPLVVALHDEGKRGEDYIMTWLDAAKERGIIVFCPTYEEPRSGVPFDHDERLLKLKRAVQEQYEVDPHRTLIAGFGRGGHYAFYMGLRYPQEFSAIASIGNAIEGSLKKLFSYSYAEVHQLPVLFLVEREEEITNSEDTLFELETFRQKGYSIETVEAERASDLKNPMTNSYILEWFEQVSEVREAGLKERPFSIRQSFYEWVDRLLQNR